MKKLIDTEFLTYFHYSKAECDYWQNSKYLLKTKQINDKVVIKAIYIFIEDYQEEDIYFQGTIYTQEEFLNTLELIERK